MTLVALPEGFRITYDVIDERLLGSIKILPFTRVAEGNDVEGILVSDHVSGFSKREYDHGIFL
jgi:hypothetical protein